jgi:hypothetical protein
VTVGRPSGNTGAPRRSCLGETFWGLLMAVGAHPGESDLRQGARRIVVGYFFLGALVRFAFAAGEIAAGDPEGWIDLTAATTSRATAEPPPGRVG